MTMNPALSHVANGRRLATRQVVMNTIASIPCQVWRKRVIQNDPATPTGTGLSWNSIALSERDEPTYDYDEFGFAYMLLDHFTGSNMLSNNSMVDGADISIMAQIEPYDNTLESKRDQILNIPEWLPKDGDLFALLIDEDLILWLEIVSISGQSMAGDFGKRYMLNKRDDLAHMEPFKSELEERETP